MIEITKVFQNTDEINKYLFKDTTPFAYCKAVVEDMIAEIRAGGDIMEIDAKYNYNQMLKKK